jgi:hypothetical protein
VPECHGTGHVQEVPCPLRSRILAAREERRIPFVLELGGVISGRGVI